ncbi:MAG: type IV pilin protein [bacterium]|jgi:prepilin-type N-terminal cleavage/methylation domain-containing protein
MKHKGFSLIELLIVVAIIGILVAIAVPNFLNAQIRARVARSQTDIRSIVTALESYRLDHNTIPPYDEQIIPTHNKNLFQLSTPVSYLNVGQLESPFSRQGRLSSGYWYYNWSIFEDREGQLRPFYWNHEENQEITRWMVSSLGPDQKTFSYRQIGEIKLLLFIEYNPSNGLTSPGIIQRHGL